MAAEKAAVRQFGRKSQSPEGPMAKQVRISGVVQVHEVKGNLSTAGYSACSSATQQPAEVRSPYVQRGSGARVRGVYGCMVFTGACAVFTGARCSIT